MKSKIVIFVLIFCFLISVAGVSATEINENQTVSASDPGQLLKEVSTGSDANDGNADDTKKVVSSENNSNSDSDILKSVEDSNDTLGATSATFSKLSTEINKGYKTGKVSLSNDYYYYTSATAITGISLSSNIEIDGNGATIDGLTSSRVF